jgi:hypothetical protein
LPASASEIDPASGLIPVIAGLIDAHALCTGFKCAP